MWGNVELLKGKEADSFIRFLKENKIYYEASGAWNYIHFEVRVNEEEKTKCEVFLQTL